jgi:hypothetical protein
MLLSRRSLLSLAGMAGISWASPKLVAKLDAAEPAKIDLDRLAGSGLYTVNRAFSYAGRWWPAGGNRVSI